MWISKKRMKEIQKHIGKQEVDLAYYRNLAIEQRIRIQELEGEVFKEDTKALLYRNALNHIQICMGNENNKRCPVCSKTIHDGD